MLLKRWLTVLTGFVGMLIILRPGLIEVSHGSMIVGVAVILIGNGLLMIPGSNPKKI